MNANDNGIPTRRATTTESEAMRKILTADARLVPFATQLADVRVRTIDEYGSLELFPAGATETPSGVMTKLRAEGYVEDSDGIHIRLLLFERSGWLCELQIYKDDGSPIRSLPSVSKLQTMVIG